MKWLLLVLVLVCLIVSGVSAGFTQNFQDTTGYTNFVTTGNDYWVKNNTGGNSYFHAYVSGFNNSNPEQTTYAAVRTIGGTSPAFTAYDSNLVSIGSCTYGGLVGAANDRVEMVVSGSTLSWYFNGVILSAYCPSSTIATNPSYVRFAGGDFDDFTYGSSAQKVVYGMPQQDIFVIKKDMINPAAAGVVFKSNGTVVSSTYMTSTWSRSAVGTTGGANESTVLANVFSGTIYATKYTGSKNTSTEYWDIATALVNSGAPYGLYETYIVGESGVHSIPINYLGTGASVSWDSDTYSQQQTATITHAVADGGYWNTGLYNYKLAIMNGNTGQFVHNESIAVQSGTSTYTFTTSDTQGTYYAVVMATDLATGADVWMNYDWASVSGYVTFTGYVNGAETNAVLSGANVSIVQGSTVVNQATTADGNYTATGFLTGATLAFNVTKSGYSQYYATLVPMVAKTIQLNFTLNSTTPVATGLGIGGIARTGTLAGSLITGGYGQPISGAVVTVKNATNGEQYTKTTNNAGWYLCDEGASCFLTTKRPYDVWGQKIGYGNSPNYTAVTA